MVRVELFQTNSKCTFIILFGLLQVTQGLVNVTKVIVAHCHVKMSRWSGSSFFR